MCVHYLFSLENLRINFVAMKIIELLMGWCREEFAKKCKDGNEIDVDRGGFEAWRCMSKKVYSYVFKQLRIIWLYFSYFK